MKSLSRLLSLSLFGLAACGGDETPGPTPTPTPQACDLSAQGTICTLAGNGENAYVGDGGRALDASMSLPMDVVVGPDGTIYVNDWNNHRLRKITAAGAMEHVAGRGELGGSLDDPANSDFNHPPSMMLDTTAENLIVAAWHNSKIRSVNLATGVITDLCGDGRRNYFGDGGMALMSTLDLPASVVYAPNGDLVFLDQANQVIRRIGSDGKINRMAGICVIDRAPPEGPGPCAAGVEPAACPMNSGKFTCGNPMTTCAAPCNPSYGGDDGPAMELRMAQPFGQSADPAGRLIYDREGNLYFADSTNSLIRMIDTSGTVRRVAGLPPAGGMLQRGYSGDGGPALEAKLNNPVDLAFGDDETLYFTDVYNHCVRAIAPDGNIRTVVGKCGMPGRTGDGGPAADATLKRPYGLHYANGLLYVADTGNNQIRAVRIK